MFPMGSYGALCPRSASELGLGSVVTPLECHNRNSTESWQQTPTLPWRPDIFLIPRSTSGRQPPGRKTALPDKCIAAAKRAWHSSTLRRFNGTYSTSNKFRHAPISSGRGSVGVPRCARTCAAAGQPKGQNSRRNASWISRGVPVPTGVVFTVVMI